MLSRLRERLFIIFVRRLAIMILSRYIVVILSYLSITTDLTLSNYDTTDISLAARRLL